MHSFRVDSTFLVALSLIVLNGEASAAGTLRGVGSSQYGQLGDGTTNTKQHSPIIITTNVTAVTAGSQHTLFIRSDSSLWGMGYNAFGQLGDGTTTALRPTPLPITTGVRSIAAGESHSLFVRLDGTLWGMGSTAAGQLGDGTFNGHIVPYQITTGVASVSARSHTTMFVKLDGTLWGMGNNSSGNLGDGTNIGRIVPVQVASNVESVAVGSGHTLFVRTDGTLWGMGNNGDGSLGIGSRIDQLSPVQISTDVKAAAAGQGQSYFIKTDGTLWGMGRNDRGQLGDGTGVGQLSSIQIASNVAAVAAGHLHGLFVKTDGTVWAMGENEDGQLGDGTTTDRLTPVKIATGVAALVAGGAHHSFIGEPLVLSRLLNLSTRGLAQTGNNVLIPGFVIGGSASKRLLIRAVGPTLQDPPINLGGTVLPNPRLTLRRYNTNTNAYDFVVANDDWGTNANAAQIAATSTAVGAFNLTQAVDAAVLMDLTPGQYTVVADDSASASGIAIVELYDADAASTDARLINISNRGFCGVGDQVMIPGFVISYESPRTLLVRVVGPTLAGAPYNVPGTMADPKLEIFPVGSSTPILANDNWGASSEAAFTAQTAVQVLAFPLAAGSKDAAFVVTLPPGSYTVVGSSAIAGGTGVVLVEVYVVP